MVEAAAAQTADSKWSEKKMEGEEGLRTLELLRGRLQAERAASRKAKEDAESMDNKLKELEQQLKKEIKARKREEKRLNSLMKKLQSLNIIYTPSSSNSEESSEQSSFNSESSFCISSTGSTGFIKVDTNEEEQEEKLEKSGDNGSTKVVDSDNVEEIVGEGKSSGLKEMKDSEENLCSKSSDCRRQKSTQKSDDEGKDPTRKSDDEGHSPSQKNADPNSDDHSMKSDSAMGNTNEVEDDVGNTMALVLVNKSEEELEACSSANNNTTKELMNYSTSEDVRRVLDTLKQIRERLQTSISDRRRSQSHIIKVG